MTQQELEESMKEHYGFDPSSIVTLISQNPQIGLALVQLPITIANSLIHKYNDLKWLDNPTSPGYYWVKSSNGECSIKEYSSTDISYVFNKKANGIFMFAGPLEPPK
jgi:hypothetical protein